MANDTWNYAGSASWTTAADWSAGVPVASSNVVIAKGNPLVTAPVSIASLVTSSPGVLTFKNAGASTVSGTVANGGKLILDGASGQGGSGLTVTGVLTNTGVLQVGASDGSLAATDIVKTAGLANSGRVLLYGGAGSGKAAQVVVTGAAGFGTAGTLAGSVWLSGYSAITFASGTISKVASHASLTLTGANAVIANSGGAGANSALAALTTNAGTIDLVDGAQITTTGALANPGVIMIESHGQASSGLTVGGALTTQGSYYSPSLSIDAAQGEGGSTLTVNGALQYVGVVKIGNYGLSQSTTVTAASLVALPGGSPGSNYPSSYSVGSLQLTSDTTTSAQTLLQVAGAAGFGSAGVLTGNVTLTGDSAIVFGSGQINTIAAAGNLLLDGPLAVLADAPAPTSNSALTGLTTIAGTLSLQDGAAVTTSGPLQASNVQLDSWSGSGGSSLTVGGGLTVTGMLSIGSASMTDAASVTASTLTNFGSVIVSGDPLASAAGLLNVASAAGFGTAGTLSGSVIVHGGGLIEFASGQINTIAQGASLTLDGAGGFIADKGALTSNSALVGLGAVAGTFALDDGAVFASAAGLLNGGSITLDYIDPSYSYSNATYAGGSSLTIGGVLTNSGALDVGNAGMTSGDAVKVAGLANTGKIVLVGNASAGAQSVLNDTGAAGFGTAGVLTGAVAVNNGGMIEFASGQIATIANGASLLLNGSQAFVADAGALTSNSALAGLATVAGSLTLANGATVKTTGALAVAASKSIALDSYGSTYSSAITFLGGSTLTVGGLLTNNGALYIGSGSITSGDTLKSAGLANAGTLSITGGASSNARAVLYATGAAGFGKAGVLSGSVNISGAGVIKFDSGQITTIASGASLSENGAQAFVTDAGATSTNSALTGLAKVAGTLNLTNGAAVVTNAALWSTGAINLDGYSSYGSVSGGSSLTVGGVLTNGAMLNIGNTGLTSSDTVKVAGLLNTGTISLVGNTAAGAQAILYDTAGAGFGSAGMLSGTVNIADGGLLEFGSGQITSIASGASLTENGAQAFVADAGTLTSNSALKGLASNAGNLYLNSGAAVAASPLSNSGSIYLDYSNYGASNLAGGSSLTVSGLLNNSGFLEAGNSAMSGNDTITVASLGNTGTISLGGNASTGAQSLLIDTGAAGFGTAGVLSGTVTLSGGGAIQFGSGQIATITSGASLTLNGPQAFLADASAAGSNSALAGLASVAGNLTLNNGAVVKTTGDLSSTGPISLDNYTYGSVGGSSLTVGGRLTNGGTLWLGGSAISSADTVNVSDLANTGTINVTGNASSGALALLNDTGAAGFGTAGVLRGTVSVSGLGSIVFGSGQITSIASGALLTLNGAQAFIADASASSSNSALAGLATNAGTLNLYNGAVVTTTGALSNTGFINLDYSTYSYGTTYSGGSSLTVGGVLTNGASLNIGNSGIAANDTVKVAGLANTGTISLIGNPSAGARALLNDTGAAGFGTAGVLSGTVNLSGLATIEFASGQIAGIASGASLTLTGGQAYVADASALNSNSALAGLANNAGSLTLQNGAAVTTTAALSNTGSINLDYSQYSYGPAYTGGSSLTVGGVLTNSNVLNVGSSTTTGNDTVKVAGLANTGTINLAGNTGAVGRALLNDTGAAGLGTAGLVTGTVNLSGLATLEFASGQITKIASGASLTLNGGQAFVADAAALTSNSALAGLASNAGSFTLQNGAAVATTVALSNTASISLDYSSYSYGPTYSGGSSLTVGGVLTNGGTLGVGNSAMTANDTVKVAGLANTGTINLIGNPAAGAQALLNDTGAAGFGTTGVLTGQVSLTGLAMIEFASGQIASVASGAALTLNGAKALVADAGALTSNSALAGLGTVAGTFALENGASVKTTGALSNTGTLELDYIPYSYGASPSGGSSLTVGGAFTNSGTLWIGGSSLAAADTLSATSLANNATIDLEGHTLLAGPIASGGSSSVYAYNSANVIAGAVTGVANGAESFNIEGGGSLEFDSSVDANEKLNFQTYGQTGGLILGTNAATTFAATINSFTTNDSIDLIGLGTGTTASFLENGSNTAGVLTVTNGAHVAHLNFAGVYKTSDFTLTSTATDTLIGHV